MPSTHRFCERSCSTPGCLWRFCRVQGSASRTTHDSAWCSYSAPYPGHPEELETGGERIQWRGLQVQSKDIISIHLPKLRRGSDLDTVTVFRVLTRSHNHQRLSKSTFNKKPKDRVGRKRLTYGLNNHGVHFVWAELQLVTRKARMKTRM